MKSREYWKDYKAVDVLGPEGKIRKELKYFGDCYVYDAEASTLKRKRAAMLLMAAAADICFVIAATRTIGANSSGPVSACGLICVIPLFFMTFGVIKNMFVSEELTKNDFRETNQYMKGGSSVMAVLGTVNALLRFLHFVFYSDHTKAGEYALSVVLFAICAALALGVYGTLKKLTVTIIPGPGVGDD